VELIGGPGSSNAVAAVPHPPLARKMTSLRSACAGIESYGLSPEVNSHRTENGSPATLESQSVDLRKPFLRAAFSFWRSRFHAPCPCSSLSRTGPWCEPPSGVLLSRGKREEQTPAHSQGTSGTLCTPRSDPAALNCAVPRLLPPTPVAHRRRTPIPATGPRRAARFIAYSGTFQPWAEPSRRRSRPLVPAVDRSHRASPPWQRGVHKRPPLGRLSCSRPPPPTETPVPR